jgi:hypothetical protein
MLCSTYICCPLSGGYLIVSCLSFFCPGSGGYFTIHNYFSQSFLFRTILFLISDISFLYNNYSMSSRSVFGELRDFLMSREIFQFYAAYYSLSKKSHIKTMKNILLRFSGVVGGAVLAGMVISTGVAYATVPTFNSSTITVGTGQTVSLSSSNGTNLYVSLNGSPVVASVSANGQQLSITGNAPGTDNLTICNTGTAADCTNVAVMVQAGTVASISFSQANPTISTGSSVTITVSGGSGGYSVSSNSNTGVATASISGSSLMITGVASGTDSLSICDSSNNCATFSVTVASSNAGSGLSFSQSSVIFSNTGVSQTVTVSGGDGSYSIQGVSNYNAIAPGISGNGITLYASNYGSGTVTVCDTSVTPVCGTISVTVGNTAAATSTSVVPSQSVMFNPASPTVSVGQSIVVALSGNAATYVVLSNQNANIAQGTTSGTNLNVLGVSAGTDFLTVCATGGGCNQVTVTVTGPTVSTTTTPQTAIPIVASVPAGSTSPQVSASNPAILSEIQALQSAVTQLLQQIQSIQSQLNQLVAQVSAGGVQTSAGTTMSSSVAASPSQFTDLLALGSTGAQVSALQERLIADGFYSGSATGYYGALTSNAVMKYQAAHGITKTGSVGSATRAALNAGE